MVSTSGARHDSLIHRARHSAANVQEFDAYVDG
jgi:hypothetical protein